MVLLLGRDDGVRSNGGGNGGHGDDGVVLAWGRGLVVAVVVLMEMIVAVG